jgi:integrase
VKTEKQRRPVSKEKRRVKGSGHIFLRGSKYYFMFVNAEGKSQMKCLGTGDRVKADAEAKAIIEKVKKYRESSEDELIIRRILVKKNASSIATINLADVWPEYDKAANRPQSSPGTHGNYKRIWERLQIWLKENHPGIVELKEITTIAASDYSSYLWSQGIAANTFNYHVKALMLITRILTASGGVEVNPWGREFITRKIQVQQKRKPFTKEMVNTILASFDKPECSISNKDEMKCLMYLGAWTGMRLFDCVNLKWSSVNLHENHIHCYPAKTVKIQRSVNIPVLAPLREQLVLAEAWRGESEYVLPKIQAAYTSDNSAFNKKMVKLFEDLGIVGKDTAVRGRDIRQFTYHSFRHFFSSQCVAAGMKIARLAELLGDSIATAGKYYISATGDDLKQMSEGLSTSPIAITGGMTDAEKLAEIKKILTGNTEVEKQILNIIKG